MKNIFYSKCKSQNSLQFSYKHFFSPTNTFRTTSQNIFRPGNTAPPLPASEFVFAYISKSFDHGEKSYIKKL